MTKSRGSVHLEVALASRPMGVSAGWKREMDHVKMMTGEIQPAKDKFPDSRLSSSAIGQVD